MLSSECISKNTPSKWRVFFISARNHSSPVLSGIVSLQRGATAMKRSTRILKYAIFSALVLAACSLQSSHPPMPEALEYLRSTADVAYAEVCVPEWCGDAYHVFRPRTGSPYAGFIFYAGSGIDVRSYAPNAYGIAKNGYMMVLVSMPNDTALLAPDRAEDVINDFPDIGAWAVGGHSMGGIAACEFAEDNPEMIDAVILWASHPSEDNRLDHTGLATLTISASNDGIYPESIIERSREHLPPDAQFAVIDGGNHFQFGWYLDDHQPVDGDAVISREEQTRRIISLTTDFLDHL